MKKNFFIILLPMILATSIFTFCPQNSILANDNNTNAVRTDTNINMWMPDKGLQQAVQQLLGKNVAITPANMATITSANLTYAGITNLTGIEYATHLKSLDLTGNTISDITPLGKIAGLNDLSLRLNKSKVLPDLKPLSTTTLTTLNLVGNVYGDQPEKMSGLSELQHLTTLKMINAHLTTIPKINPLSQLTTLDLSGNKITDINVLSEFKHLTYLGLSSNAISDWHAIANLDQLTQLLVGNNPKINLYTLNQLPNLKKVNLSQIGLTNQDIKLLAQKMPNITALAIDFNGNVSDLTPISHLTNLTDLDFSKNAVTDVTPLKTLINLTNLNLSNNQVSNVTPLQHLKQLSSLTLLRNRILDLSPLNGLQNLAYLNAKSQLVYAAPIKFSGHQAQNQVTLAVKDIDGTIIPLEYQSGLSPIIVNSQLTYNNVTKSGETNLAWDNSTSKNKISRHFTGSVIQPINLVDDTPHSIAKDGIKQPVQIQVMKGNNSDLTSVASNYIMKQATLITLSNGSVTLNFTAMVPYNYGKNSLTFKNARRITEEKSGDSWLFNYVLVLTKKDLEQGTIMESMHVAIDPTVLNYNHIYPVYFKILSQPNQNTNHYNDSNVKTIPITKSVQHVVSPLNYNHVIIQLLRSDNSHTLSIANNYIIPQAKLMRYANGSSTLLFTTIVPQSYGENSIIFQHANLLNRKKFNGHFISNYELPLSTDELGATVFLRQITVDIPNLSYKHKYYVYFNVISGASQLKDAKPRSMLTTMLPIYSPLKPSLIQYKTTEGSLPSKKLSKKPLNQYKTIENDNPKNENNEEAHKLQNKSRFQKKDSYKPKNNDILKKATCFVGSFLAVILFYFLKTRKR